MAALEILRNLFENQLGVDVALKVPKDIRKIKAHRTILIGACGYFENLFLGSWSSQNEVDNVTISLPDLNYETLEMLVKFLYTEEFQFKNASCSLRTAILAADFLMMDVAMGPLSGYVKEHIGEQNAVDLYEVADKLLPETATALQVFIRKHIHSVYVYPKLLKLPFKEFAAVVKDDKDVPVEPKDILCTIRDWVEVDRETRNEFVQELLCSIVFRQVIPANFIIEHVIPICPTLATREFVMGLANRREIVKSGFSDYFEGQRKGDYSEDSYYDSD